MTPKQLLGISIDDLEKMSDDELVKYLTPFIIITHGEKKIKQSSVIDTTLPTPTKVKKKRETMLEAALQMKAMIEAQLKAQGK